MEEGETGYRSEEEERAAREFTNQESDESSEKEKIVPFDAIIVLGCGPVKKPLYEQKPEKFKKSTGWQMNMEAKMRTIAAGEAYLEGLTRKLILTGGKTGGPDLPSEAEVMRNMLVKKIKVPQQDILIEDRSTNTIENFANVMNIIDQAPQEYQSTAVLSNQYHVNRAKILAKSFSGETQGQAAEPILDRRSEKYRKVLDRFFSSPQYQDKLKGEVRWTRGLDEIPLYWLPQAMAVENPARLKKMLEVEKVQQTVDEILKAQGIVGGLDAIEDLNQIREIVRSMPREMPPEEWASLEGDK